MPAPYAQAGGRAVCTSDSCAAQASQAIAFQAAKGPHLATKHCPEGGTALLAQQAVAQDAGRVQHTTDRSSSGNSLRHICPAASVPAHDADLTGAMREILTQGSGGRCVL